MSKSRMTAGMSLDALIVANDGWTGGEFDFISCAPHTCSSWLVFYSARDGGATEEHPEFWLKVLYMDPCARLVATDAEGRFRVVKASNGVLRFNALHPFGLLPVRVADAVVTAQSLDIPEYKVFYDLISGEPPRTRPKLVWDWSDDEGNIYNY